MIHPSSSLSCRMLSCLIFLPCFTNISLPDNDSTLLQARLPDYSALLFKYLLT
jgi:hypothetical protein